MGKRQPSAPAPVIINPQSSAEGQAAYNKEAAQDQRTLNMVDQYTPEGSLTYSPTGETVGGIDRFQATQTLAPSQQRLFDLSNDLSEKYGTIGNTQLDAVSGKLSTPFDLSSLGAMPTINEDTRTNTMNAMMARQQPGMDRARAKLQTELANQGFVSGSEGYNEQMDEMIRRENDMGLAADAAAGNEMARMYGLESSGRDRAVNEILMQRNQPLAELSALMSGSQPGSPNFVPTPQGQVAAPDLMGAEFGAANQQNAFNQNQYNQQMNAYNSNLSGMYGLGGAGLGAAGYAWSDRRLKKNIARVGTLTNGLPVYEYEYIWGGGRHVGLMADEVKQVRPKAVARFGAFDAVNYAKAVM